MRFIFILDLLTREQLCPIHPCAGTGEVSMEGGQRELLSQLCSLTELLSRTNSRGVVKVDFYFHMKS